MFQHVLFHFSAPISSHCHLLRQWWVSAHLGELEVWCIFQPLHGVPCRGGSLWPAHLDGLDLYIIFQHPSPAIATCSGNGGFTCPFRRVGGAVFYPAPVWSPMQGWVLVARSSRQVGSLLYFSTPLSSHCHLQWRWWVLPARLGESEVQRLSSPYMESHAGVGPCGPLV